MRRNCAAPSTRCPLISVTTSFSFSPALAAGCPNDLSQHHAAFGGELQFLGLSDVTSWVSTPSQLEPSSPMKTLHHPAISGITSIRRVLLDNDRLSRIPSSSASFSSILDQPGYRAAPAISPPAH